MVDLQRLLRHLWTPPGFVRQVLPASALQAIETAISECETRHGGRIRFAGETRLALGALLHNQSTRERAIEVFSEQRVWDTEDNNGILIYLLLADHDVEIVADRGIHARVGSAEWERIRRDMKQSFITGRFEEGVIAGVRALSVQLERHYPRSHAHELSNKSEVL